MQKFITKTFKAEKERLVLWTPVLFMLGAITYFSLKNEPPYSLCLLVPAFSASLLSFCFVFHRPALEKYIITAILVFSLGFAAAQFRTNSVKSVSLNAPVGPIYLHATVADIETMNHGSRLLLKENDLYRFPHELTPKYIRLNVRTDMENIEPGDRIGVRVMLSPAPGPVYPGAYDFSFYSYFRQIGAVGYSISKVRLLKKSKNISETINRLRYNISGKIRETLNEGSENNGAVAMAVALLIGMQTGIPVKTFQNMRDSGLAHIISISGLHMAIVMASSFFIIRAFLAMVPRVALRARIKKWSALFAIIAGLFYLLLAGAPVPAVRSYIMASLFFITIILDRVGTFMRPVAIAALLIIAFEPEVVMNAGFQMSFAAVIALVSAFESSEILRPQLIRERGLITRISLYLFSVCVASVVAGLATASFVIYHFGNFQLYGLLANLIAVPVTSFLIMPFGMLALVLMPFGGQAFGLFPMKWGIDFILYIAQKVSELPLAVIAMPSLSGPAILVIAIGGLWLCLWKTHIRQLGIFAIILGLSTLAFHNPPDIVVDRRGKLFAVKAEDGKLYFSSKTSARFARTVWQRLNGQKDAEKIEEFTNTDSVNLHCDSNSCLYKNHKKTTFIILPGSENTNCLPADIVINLVKQFKCEGQHATITANALASSGTHAIWLEHEKIKTVKDVAGKRLWNTGKAETPEDEETF